MSACISNHGEYSEHTPDAEWTCTLCGDVDTAGLRAEVNRLRAGIEALCHRWRGSTNPALHMEREGRALLNPPTEEYEPCCRYCGEPGSDHPYPCC